MVKNPLANAREVRDGSSILGSWEDPPEGRHGNPLPYPCLENPWTEKPDGLQSMGSQRVGHDGSNLAQHGTNKLITKQK